MTDIFISHASADKDFARKLSADLKRAGHEPWLDEWDVRIGESIVSGIERGIDRAEHLILVLSPRSVKSSWVAEEWRSAYWQQVESGRVKILPVLIEECEIPTFLRSRRYADFRTDYSAGFFDLVHRGLLPAKRDRDQDRLVVWYLDDSRHWLDTFQEHHGEEFEIHPFDNVAKFLKRLQAVSAGAPDFPSIVLLDLYMPLSEFEVDRDLLRETERRVERFFDMEKELRGYVDAAWRPFGVEIINTVRDCYPEDLPIAIYTQRGLVLLNDELIRDLERLGVSWVLKDRFNAETERLMFHKIMMQGHRRPGPSRRVLMIDDNPRFIDKFRDKHAGYYEIVGITDQGEVLPTLERMRGDSRPADLLLVDLYYPRGSGPEAQEKIGLANRKLQEFHDFEQELQGLVAKTYEPIGMRVLEQVRELYSAEELPVLVYTQCGLLLLDDSRMRRIEALDTGWMLKDRYSARTEQAKIIGQVLRARRQRGGASLG